MKKYSKILILLLLSMFLLSACTKNPDNTDDQTDAKTLNIPVKVLGYYYEEVAGRGVINVEKVKDNLAKITIDWASSASENAHWDIEATYDGEKLNYENAKLLTQVYDTTGNHADTENYHDGTGYFIVEEDCLVWHNDKKDSGDMDFRFVRDYVRADENADMPNPWIETDDINVAIKNAGVEFDPPIEEALPAKVKLIKYLSTQGTISALYEDADNSLLIRKSNTIMGQELTGDYTAYTKTWKHKLKGLEVNCAGDGKLANVVWFETNDFTYSFNYNTGQEGKGLSMDEINSIVNGMESVEPIK